MVKRERIRELQPGTPGAGRVIYWMSRDQRIDDNWAFLYMQEKAKEMQREQEVVFCLVPNFLEATIRQYYVMIEGLREVEKRCVEIGVRFTLLLGTPGEVITTYCLENDTALLICDFDPLKIKRKWKAELLERVNFPVEEVDAHNIIPVWIASPKEEYAARTIRPKIHRLLGDYLEEFPKVESVNDKVATTTNWENIYNLLKVDRKVSIISEFAAGYSAGMRELSNFVLLRYHNYIEMRNDPTKNGQSNLSPYLHFGQIAPQRAALEAAKKTSNILDDSFLEELIVRRELSDNFCYYNENYDNFLGLQPWAQKTLNEQRADKREYIYTLDVFESASTHDPLWNAAQLEMVLKGKMHGFMRMYWAKKILEWTESPDVAISIAIYLNDKYEIDGRDPNGYVGCLWAIGGVHDRAWAKRPIYGLIRYMNYNGCKSKFDVIEYIKQNKRGNSNDRR